MGTNWEIDHFFKVNNATARVHTKKPKPAADPGLAIALQGIALQQQAARASGVRGSATIMAALAAARANNPLAGMNGAAQAMPASAAAALGGYLPVYYSADPTAMMLDRYALAAAQNQAAVATSKRTDQLFFFLVQVMMYYTFGHRLPLITPWSSN